MGGCGNKIKMRCGSKQFSTCVEYELDLPSHTKLQDTDCASIEDTTKDLYDITGEILDNSDLSELGSNCLSYILDPNGKKVIKNVLLKYEEEICSLKDEIEKLKTTSLCDRDITSCVDTSGLSDPCGDSITTLGQLLQFLTNQHNTP